MYFKANDIDIKFLRFDAYFKSETTLSELNSALWLIKPLVFTGMSIGLSRGFQLPINKNYEKCLTNI